jgi:hypothetical protein
MGEQWLQWVASLDASWARPLREQLEAMYPHLCEWECEAFMTRTGHFCWVWSHAMAECDTGGNALLPGVGFWPYLCRHDCELVANWMTRP